MKMSQILSQEKINNALDIVLNTYKLIELDLTSYKDFWANKILIKAKTLYNYDCLYLDSQESIVDDYVIDLFSDSFVRLVSSANFEKILLGNFKTIDTLDNLKTNSKTKVGYSGYQVENQAGTYGNSEVENTSSGTNRLQTLEYLNTITNNWVESLISTIKKNLVKLIY